MRLDYRGLRGSGHYGYGWSTIAERYMSSALANSYRFIINPSNVVPSGQDARYSGYPVRCLVYIVKESCLIFLAILLHRGVVLHV